MMLLNYNVIIHHINKLLLTYYYFVKPYATKGIAGLFDKFLHLTVIKVDMVALKRIFALSCIELPFVLK